MHVLICDDDPDMQFLLKHILTLNKCQVTQAMNMKDVLSYSQIHFDLIIMDYYLDKDNGLDVLESFRQKACYDSPVILLTGREFEESSIWRKQYRLLDVIHKPFDPAWLSDYFKQLRL